MMWVKAEIVRLNYYPQNGHSYPTLVEKEHGTVLAEMRGTIWKRDFDRINSQFIAITKQPLGDNMTVVMQANISYHPVHGLALMIHDIDPNYTLGELARQRLETIARLKKEGIFYKNRTHDLPLVPKKIAVISVETSKGYNDFISIIQNNSAKFRFTIHLFPAVLQGVNAIKSIKAQLKAIAKIASQYDCVTIIRGGGGEVGLSCFDDYTLAKEIADFPLPVLTGIGHSTNETISEMVSYKNFITPSKMGDFLLEKAFYFLRRIESLQNHISRYSTRLLEEEKRKIFDIQRLYFLIAHHAIDKEKKALNSTTQKLKPVVRQRIEKEKKNLFEQFKTLKGRKESILYQGFKDTVQIKGQINSFQKELFLKQNMLIDFVEKKIELLSPQNILKRGFTISRIEGKTIQDSDKIPKGAVMKTQFYGGELTSIIETKKKK